MSDSDSELQSSVAHEELVSRPDDRGDRVGGGAVLPRTTAAMTRAGLGAPVPAESSEVPRIEAEPRTLRFTAAPGEESAPASTRLTNVGSQPFHIEDLALDDGERSGFVVYGIGSDIPPGGAVEVQVAFRPHPQKTTSDRLKGIGNRGAKAVSIALRGKVVTSEKAQDARASAIVAQARQWKYPSPPKTYREMLDALTASSELMDGPEDQRPDPFDYTHARELSEPVVRELDEVASFERIADLKRKLELNGMTQQVVDARIGNAKLAARTFMERAILGGSINGDYTLNQFQAGREEILLLTGEKKPDSSELKQLDAAADTALKGHLIGYAAVVAAPALAVLAAEAAPLAAAQAAVLWSSSSHALAGLSTWALANPMVATELAGIALGLGLEIGEFGIGNFLSQLETPEGTAFLLMQLFTHYVSVRGAAADWDNAGAQPRNSRSSTSDSNAPTPPTAGRTGGGSSEAEDALAKVAARLGTFVEAVKSKRKSAAGALPDAAGMASESTLAEARGPKSSPPAARAEASEVGDAAPNTGVAGPTGSARITAPVEGLFDAVPNRMRAVFHDPMVGGIEGQLSDRIRQGPGGKEIIKTIVTLPDGRVGIIERAYDPKTKTLEMMNAFLDNLPSWVAEPGVPSMGPKGVPTVTYLTLRQMKILEVGYGQLSRVKMSTIQNARAILEFNVAIKAGADPNVAILDTHSVQYASTSIQQSGHRIVSAEVVLRGKSPFSEMLDHYETDALTGAKKPDVVDKHDRLIAKFGNNEIDRDTEVEWNYDVYLNVAPLGGEP